jgi:hypothetical protein
MKTKANRVWRWVERMNASGNDMPEFPDMEAELIADDQIPETLIPVLEIIAKDYLPELKSLCDFTHGYLKENPDINTGDAVTSKEKGRNLGGFRTQIRGQDFDLMARHYSIWMLQRLTDDIDTLTDTDNKDIQNLFNQTGLNDLISLKIGRRIKRENYKEVWA